MDALFLPLADAIGASVDQIKVCPLATSAFPISWLTWDSISLLGYIMSLDRLPLGSLFVRVPSTQLALRHFHRGSIFFPYLEDLFRVLPTPGQYFGDLFHCQV